MNLKILLNTSKVFESRRVGSKLFDSLVVEGQKKFLKKLRLMSKKECYQCFCSIRIGFFFRYESKKVLGTSVFEYVVKHL